jgi:hypothetical protein
LCFFRAFARNPENCRKIAALPRAGLCCKVKWPENEVSAMKKKGHPNIPDFSSKRTAPPAPGEHIIKPKQPELPNVHGGKPHATSKKSGRRGG